MGPNECEGSWLPHVPFGRSDGREQGGIGHAGITGLWRRLHAGAQNPHRNVHRHLPLLRRLVRQDSGGFALLPVFAIVLIYARCVVQGKVIPINHARPNKNLTYTKREPIGVCGIITPWNYPLMMLAWKMSACLAAGNTVVLKPAQVTPLTSLKFGELVVKAGFPEGVINIIPGSGESCRWASGERLMTSALFQALWSVRASLTILTSRSWASPGQRRSARRSWRGQCPWGRGRPSRGAPVEPENVSLSVLTAVP